MILPEVVTVGIYDSRIVAKKAVTSKNRKTTMFEIELPVEDGGISYIDSNAKPITPNMIICAKPGQVRHTKFPFKCYFVHMIVHSGTLYDTLMGIPDHFETDKREDYEKIFKRLIRHYNTLSDSEEIILQSLVLELIYTIQKDSVKRMQGGNAGSSNTVIEKSLQYIKDHLTEDLRLESLSQQMSLSPVYFHTAFRTSVGKTLREYVEEQRLKKAIHLLMTTNDSLAQIAYEAGFSSQSYFSYVFKRKMKVTPREYAKEIYDKYEI